MCVCVAFNLPEIRKIGHWDHPRDSKKHPGENPRKTQEGLVVEFLTTNPSKTQNQDDHSFEGFLLD